MPHEKAENIKWKAESCKQEYTKEKWLAKWKLERKNHVKPEKK